MRMWKMWSGLWNWLRATTGNDEARMTDLDRAYFPVETAQTRVWQGEFGRAYTDRNTLETTQLDSLWTRNYGVSRSAINGTFLEGIPRSARFLEVGCNVGNQLLLLQSQGY